MPMSDGQRFGRMLLNTFMHALVNKVVWRMPLMWAIGALVIVLLVMWFTKMF
jgi:hypothetical protein